MKLQIKGKGPVDLTQKDYVATGGEGSIYARSQTAYKVYLDPKKMISTGKIQELAAITHPNIIKPEDVLLDTKNHPVGYTMRFVQDTYALCQLFTKAFRTRNNVSPDMILALVRKLQEIVQHVHSKNILIVDLNELNFLASHDFKDIFAIDVDSWQTPSFPATAIMESIRDRHSKTFSQGTDWFSFAITAFQMMIGINPYKGKHSSIKSIEERMIKNISALNSAVSLPGACYPFSVIPDAYRQWFKAVLDDGKRLPPPTDLNAVIAMVQTINRIVGSDNFEIEELESFQSNLIDALYHGAWKVFLTSDGLHINRSVIPNIPTTAKIVFSPKNNTVISASIERGMVKLLDANKQKEIPCTIAATDIMKYNDNLYLKSGGNVIEVSFHELPTSIIPTTKVVAQCMEKATKFFDGVVIQNLLGSYYVSLFPIAHTHLQFEVKELQGYTIVDAKYQNNLLMVVGNKNGKYDKFIMRIVDCAYDIRIVKDISILHCNFVVLDNGICVHLTDDEEIEVFSNKKDSASMKVISDQNITGDVKLMKQGIKLMFSKNNKLYSIKMKTKS